MFSKALLVILLAGAIVSDLTYAQQIQGSIEDYETKSPISYALITNTKRTVGISTDSAGFFKIPSNLSSQFDSIQVSAIGYKTTVVALEGTKHLTIELQKNTVEIKREIGQTVKKFTKRIKIGALHKLEDGSFGGAVNSGNECSTLIINPNKYIGRIKNISFYVLDDGVYNTPFRIRVYHNNKDKPGEEITTRNIIVRGYRKNAWNKFDVSPYNLILPLDGCFISMEWLNWGDEKYRYEMSANSGDFGYGQSIGLTSEFLFSSSFMRSNGKEWKTWEEWWGLNKESTIILPTIYTPMIRAEVFY